MTPEKVRRYSIAAALLTFLPVFVILRLFVLLTNPEQVAAIEANRVLYSVSNPLVESPRGEIVDRWGNLLAGNRTMYEVGVDLRSVENPETIAQTLDIVLDLDYADVFTKASIPYSQNAVYAVLAGAVPPEKIEEIQRIWNMMDSMYSNSKNANAPSLEGLTWRPRLQRSYPEEDLASNLLGFVTRYGQGYYGVEGYYDNLLQSQAKRIQVPLNPNLAEERRPVSAGASLVLTIDRSIQSRMEEVLDDAIDTSGSDSGTIVVIDPKTGELLALATTPRFDLNNYDTFFTLFSPETPFNRGVSYSYEPGSVYKVLTMAAAFDSGAVDQETVFIDTGVFEFGGVPVYNWNRGAWGPQTMLGCLQHSLNVCLAWVASEVGTGDFYRYMRAFGIGRVTGIDLAGEAAGRLKIPGDADWYDADLATNAFGQGVSATPVQMASAITALANGGKIMAPHIVRSMVNRGYQQDTELRVVSTPIRPETARLLTQILAESLEIESSNALVTGYRVAGKTGTAEIPTEFGYTSSQTNASFVGWGPVDDPRFLVYIWLEKPTVSPWGSEVAAPVFKTAVEELVVLMDIPPDDIRLQLSSSAMTADVMGNE